MRRLFVSLLSLLAFSFFASIFLLSSPTYAWEGTWGPGNEPSGGSGSGGDGRRTWVFYTYQYDANGRPINEFPTVGDKQIKYGEKGCAGAGGFFFAYASDADGKINATKSLGTRQYFDPSRPTQNNSLHNNCNGRNGAGGNDIRILTDGGTGIPYCMQGLTPPAVTGLDGYSIPSRKLLDILAKSSYNSSDWTELKNAFRFTDEDLNAIETYVHGKGIIIGTLSKKIVDWDDNTVESAAVVKILGAIEDKLDEEFGKISGGRNLTDTNVAWFCSAAESTFTGSSKAPSDYSNSDEKTYPEFTHTITRSGGDSSPTYLNNEATILTTCTPSSACANTSGESWITNGIVKGLSDTTKSSVEVTLNPGDTVKVCQKLNYETKKTSGFAVEITNKSIGAERGDGNEACVTITRPIEATIHATATVLDGNSGSTKKSYTSGNNNCTVSVAGSSYNANCNDLSVTLPSFSPNYSVSFNHSLQATGFNNITIGAGVKIYHSENKGSYSNNVLNGTSSVKVPNSTTIRPATSATYSGSLGEGGEKTLCEVVMLTGNKQTFANTSATTPSSTTSVGVAAEVCAKINRLKAKKETISARGSVYDDIYGKDRTGDSSPVLSKLPWSSRYANFKFALSNSSSDKTPSSVYYEIDYKIDGVEKLKATTGNASVGTGASAGNILYKLGLSGASGTKHILCARVHYKTSSYRVESNGAVTSLETWDYNSNGDSNHYVCVTYTRPETKVFPTKITVKGESKADIDGATVGPAVTVPGTSTTAYPVKGSSARATFTHILSRGVEYHDPKGTNDPNDSLRVAAIAPEDDITDLRYIPDDPGKSYSPSSFNSRSNNRLSTNSANSYPETVSGLGASIKVGQIETKCRKVYFNSEIYQLQGLYYVVDGNIYTGDHGEESIQGRKTPVRVPADGTVGSSTEACISVTRPYNFKITTIDAPGSTKPANTSTTVSTTFTINVEKNDNAKDYLLTDLPKSPESDVEVITFVLSEKPGDRELTGEANSPSSPCDHFRSKLGGKMRADSCITSETTSLSSHNNNEVHSTDSYTISQAVSTKIPSDVGISDKFCVAIAIRPASSNINGSYGFSDSLNYNRTISNATCFNVGKYPSFQSWGGSTYTKGGTETSVSNANSNGVAKLFGSWSDFMIIAKKQVKNTASGASLISGVKSFTDCSISPLTVSNSECKNDNRLGFSNLDIQSNLIDGIKSRYITGSGKYFNLGDKEQVGKSHVIRTSTLNSASSLYPILIYNGDNNHKDIYIAENIDTKMSDRTYNDLAVPQIIIYSKGDIYISPNVSTIDAWLLAEGTIMTCANEEGVTLRTTTDVDTCMHELKVNGPVVASKIIFDRTYGSDAHESDGSNTITHPAERFDFNPSVFLFGTNESKENAQPVTTYIHKLPPRY